MARYREEAERAEREGRPAKDKKTSIETIPKSCPICKGDVKGSDVYLYFCKHCNLLFRKMDLVVTGERIEATVKKSIAEKYSGELSIGVDKISLKELKKGIRKAKPEKTGEKIPKIPMLIKYVASKSSNKVHIESCPFAKNINKSNRIIFRALNEAKKYKRCKCIEE